MECTETQRWRSHVCSQVRSGLSQAVYCRIYGIPSAQFARWRRAMWAERLEPLMLVPVRVDESRDA